MLTLKTNVLKYKNSSGQIQDIGAVVGEYTSDTTLSLSGVGADAKIVGDKFKNFENKLDNYYLKTEADVLHIELQNYVDSEVAALVNAAPETLDTLGELAIAFEENQDMVETLNEAITYKADKTDLQKTQELVNENATNISTLQSQVIHDSFIMADAITGDLYKIQIQNGQLVSLSVDE